jgi:hypothetical protein
VPESCFVVRLQDEWMAHEAGSTRIQTADFSPADEEPWVPQLCQMIADQLSQRLATRLPDDSTWRRAIFVDGAGCVRVWGASAVLLSDIIEVVRIDRQQPGNDDEPVLLLSAMGPALKVFGPSKIRSVKREIFVGVGDQLAGGETLQATLSVEPGAVGRLQKFGLQLDTGTSTWRRGPFSVRFTEPTRVLVKLALS